MRLHVLDRDTAEYYETVHLVLVDDDMLLVITGGGTGGHIYPALSVAERIRERNPSSRVFYIGSSSGPEAKLAEEYGFEFKGLRLRGFGGSFYKTTSALSLFAIGTVSTLRFFRKTKPDCVFSTGGYASAPACFASWLMRIPLVLHEMNVKPGMVTKYFSKRADVVTVAFEETGGMISARRVVRTGIPVREEIENLRDQDVRKKKKSEGLIEFELDEERKTLLVFGGSQGADSLNRALWETDRMSPTPSLQILHLTGVRGYDENKVSNVSCFFEERNIVYRALPYTEKMDLALACADLCLCRAGAASVYELLVAGVPALLVPLPHAKDAHQKYNAQLLKEYGVAEVVMEDEQGAKKAFEVSLELLARGGKLSEMQKAIDRMRTPPAAVKVVELIEKLCAESKK
ncbi:MAG: undecaprenyldiphospho-muramoylpentapeptide beta-N-acetylglucosaminyltransferase [Actinomycetota bacterium]|nr:undecaprenyldiphospho-muramoylpentapeptide beta-N-acetylglucosaminyltransferase [Actinomycetota bacterium]